MEGGRGSCTGAAIHLYEISTELDDAGEGPTLIVVGRGVVTLEEGDGDAYYAAGFEDAMDFGDDSVGSADVFQHCLGDNSVEGLVYEGEGVSICDDVYFGEFFYFEVDNVRGAAAGAGPEVQDFCVRAEVADKFFDAPIPAGCRVGTTDEVREERVLPEFMFDT